MGKVQSDTTETKVNRGSRTAPLGNPHPTAGQPAVRAIVTTNVTVYGPQPESTPCVIVRQGEDPAPTCVNPQCPKADNCRKHIVNRTDPRTPSIAIITWYRCGHYDPIDPEKYKDNEQQHSSPTTA